MEEVVSKFKKYVETYKPKHTGGMESVFIKDMLYGIGIAIDDKYRFGSGFDLWKKELQNMLK